MHNILQFTHKINSVDIDISDSGYAVLDASWNAKDVCDPFSRLYIIKSGSGYVTYNNKTIKLNSGNVYFIPSELNFSYKCISLEKLYFHVSLTGIEKYDTLSSVKNIFSLPIPEEKTEYLKSLYISDDYMDLITLKTEIYKIITAFSQKYDFKHTYIKSYSDTILKTMKFIQKNAKISLNANDIAKQLFISESKLRKSFKKEVGITIGEYIDDIVFLKAKKLLLQKNLLIREISDQLGFCDQFYFSRRFKEKYTKTPSEYRKTLIF